MRNIDEIIIHCAAVPKGWRIDQPVEAQVEEIRRWHLARGWSDIGYHAIGHQDGSIGLGRDRDHDGDIWEEIGAHVRGRNATTLSYCLIGGAGARADDEFEDHFTPKQDRNLRGWVRDRLEQFPTITKISGHNQYAAKACPGFYVPDWWAREPVSIPKASAFSDAVRRLLRALFAEMFVQLGAQRPFRKRLGQFGKNALLAEKVAGRTPFHQPVQQVFGDAHTWVSSKLSYHAKAQNSG